jgi:GNAT superfamily N-acetyltransferase
MISVKLDKEHHHREGFECGVAALNRYLSMMANQQSSKDNSRTYVITADEHSNQIVGYYTLTMASLDLTALPPSLQKKHASACSAGLLARLAVDKRFAKQGYGEWLLIDALHRLLDASDTVGFPVVLVDAKDGVAGFYERFGFKAFKDTPHKLFMTTSDIRQSLACPPINNPKNEF